MKQRYESPDHGYNATIIICVIGDEGLLRKAHFVSPNWEMFAWRRSTTRNGCPVEREQLNPCTFTRLNVFRSGFSAVPGDISALT